MKLIELLTIVSILSFGLIGCQSTKQDRSESSKQQSAYPNIVLIYADDMGYGDVGYLGSEDIRTPAIDKLAGEGVYFTQAYVSASVCGPSRAGLMTGVYQQRFGCGENGPEGRWYAGETQNVGIPSNQPMLSELLEPFGYKSKMVGKWHLGLDEDLRPCQRGFDEFYGFINGSHDYYKADTVFTNKAGTWPMFRNNNIVKYEGYATEVFSDEAVDFINENAGKEEPLFVYLAYNAVHHPWQVPDKYVERMAHIEHPDRRFFGGMLLAMDDGIGRVVEALKEKEVYNNTIILFISDNGSPRGQKGPAGQGKMSSTGGFRGWKGDTYEGGIRVPYLMTWPDVLPQGKMYDKPVSNLDVVPTIMALLGVTSNGVKNDFDGVNLLPYITGQMGEESPHELLYFRRDNDYAIRKGKWKLTWNDSDLARPEDANKPLLFDMDADKYETTDLAEKHPEILKDLQSTFDAWDSQLPKSLWWGEPTNRKHN